MNIYTVNFLYAKPDAKQYFGTHQSYNLCASWFYRAPESSLIPSFNPSVCSCMFWLQNISQIYLSFFIFLICKTLRHTCTLGHIKVIIYMLADFTESQSHPVPSFNPVAICSNSKIHLSIYSFICIIVTLAKLNRDLLQETTSSLLLLHFLLHTTIQSATSTHRVVLKHKSGHANYLLHNFQRPSDTEAYKVTSLHPSNPSAGADHAPFPGVLSHLGLLSACLLCFIYLLLI